MNVTFYERNFLWTLLFMNVTFYERNFLWTLLFVRGQHGQSGFQLLRPRRRRLLLFMNVTFYERNFLWT